MSRAIVTVGIHPTRGFGKYVERFRTTFAEHGCADEVIAWDEQWPPGSPPHWTCHYAFKVYAVRRAIERGHREVLWFDCSAFAIKSIEPLWQRLRRDGHILISDKEPLGKWCSDHSLAHFAMSRDDAMKLKLMCGTCWGIDASNPRSLQFLNDLGVLAVPEHFNGTHVSSNPAVAAHPRPDTEGARVSNDERVWGHRCDEVYMSLLADKLAMRAHAGIEFTGGMEPTEQTCVRSGYDLP